MSATQDHDLVRKWINKCAVSPRPDWNRLGPHVPSWFRRELRKIDPRLAMQFIPPMTVDPAGVSPHLFPGGMWAICRKMPHSGMLCKRWNMTLTNQYGFYQKPTRETVRVLRMSKLMHRMGRGHELEQMFDRSCAALLSAASSVDRDRVANEIATHIRKSGQGRQWGNRASMNGSVAR